jgi:hypothetical protein
MRRDGPEFPARFVFAFGAVRAFQFRHPASSDIPPVPSSRQFRHPASSVIPAEAGIHCDFILRAAEKQNGFRPSPE